MPDVHVRTLDDVLAGYDTVALTGAAAIQHATWCEPDPAAHDIFDPCFLERYETAAAVVNATRQTIRDHALEEAAEHARNATLHHYYSPGPRVPARRAALFTAMDVCKAVRTLIGRG